MVEDKLKKDMKALADHLLKQGDTQGFELYNAVLSDLKERLNWIKCPV